MIIFLFLIIVKMNPILVRNIKHLTDARYFAAMGVDWMSIELSTLPSTFSLWHTLKDWIEGVKLAAEIPADDEMLLARTIIEAGPNGIILNQLIFPDVPKEIRMFFDSDVIKSINGADDATIILSYEKSMLTSRKMLELSADKIFLQSAWTLYELKSLLDTGYSGGICFSGGEEDKTGVRDYGMVDDLFELIYKKG
jgi:hypothetical protein